MAGSEDYVPSSWAEIDKPWAEFGHRTAKPREARTEAPTAPLDAGLGLAAYVAENGIRNESVRLGYLAKVRALDGYDNAGRADLKDTWRPVTPAAQRALIEAGRPGTGPNVGSSGNANRTNPAATGAAKTWGLIGRGNALLAVALGAYDVARSEDKARAAAGVAGSTAGGVAGGVAGAEAGAIIGAPFFPPYGPAVGAVIGGVAGAVAGGMGGDWAGEEVFKLIAPRVSKPAPASAGK